MDSGVAGVFQKQYGPLAAWQWLGVGIGGYLLYSRFRSSGSTAASDAASTASGGTAIGGGTDPVTGEPVTATDLISGSIGASYDLSNQLGILNSTVGSATTATTANTGAQSANTAATTANTTATTGNTAAVTRATPAHPGMTINQSAAYTKYQALQKTYLDGVATLAAYTKQGNAAKIKAWKAETAKRKSAAAAALVAYRKSA